VNENNNYVRRRDLYDPRSLLYSSFFCFFSLLFPILFLFLSSFYSTISLLPTIRIETSLDSQSTHAQKSCLDHCLDAPVKDRTTPILLVDQLELDIRSPGNEMTPKTSSITLRLHDVIECEQLCTLCTVFSVLFTALFLSFFLSLLVEQSLNALKCPHFFF
jgi:hypothetical protein